MIESMVGGLHSIMPGTKTIRYCKRQAVDGWAAGVKVSGAEKRPLRSDKALMVGIGIDETGGVWHVWRDKISVTPEPGDKLLHDGETWHVKAVDEELLGKRFRLTCVKER